MAAEPSKLSAAARNTGCRGRAVSRTIVDPPPRVLLAGVSVSKFFTERNARTWEETRGSGQEVSFGCRKTLQPRLQIWTIKEVFVIKKQGHDPPL
jgi:hypothetical protein